MHLLTTRFSPLPSAGLRDFFKPKTQRGLPKRVVAQINNLEVKWDLE